MLALALALSLTLAGCAGEPRDEEVVVFAAASLRDSVAEVGNAFEAATGVRTIFNFAGSNVLARQIEAAPVADVFLSADEAWVDHLERLGRVAAANRRGFLSNRLVVIAHRSSPHEIATPEELAGLDFEHLSLGDPAAVPAGRYARSFLEAVPVGEAHLWRLLEARVVPAPDVRAALALVAAEPDALGVVYRTDVAASDGVRVLYEVPPTLAPEIRYGAALVEGAPAPALGRRFLDFLGGAEAQAIFERWGFLIPEAAPDGG